MYILSVFLSMKMSIKKILIHVITVNILYLCFLEWKCRYKIRTNTFHYCELPVSVFFGMKMLIKNTNTCYYCISIAESLNLLIIMGFLIQIFILKRTER